MAVWFRLLGGIEAEVEGVPVDLGTAKQRAVLAVLLVEADRLVPVDRLLAGVWGEDVPARARNSLYTYLSGLRAALAGVEGVRFARGPGGYRLTVDELTVDLHQFRDLVATARMADDERAAGLFEQAASLWRGEPLPELDTPWAVGVRAAAEGERQAAESDHADVALRLGRHAELLPGLVERARRHPLDERTAGQLMLAWYRSGRQADALEHYRRVRELLVEELGADPGPALQRLHARILAADPELAAPLGPVATAAATPVVPRQLPAPPRPFTGRADESAALTAALEHPGDGTTVVISALAGTGGIGKTWLALHWAHHHLDRFPDGQLFTDLRGFSPSGTPTAPEAALRGFLDALGVSPDRVPHDLDARAALYRSLVAERRMLIVLDNAATPDQVVPLLPGSPSCTVLVTSRNRLPALVARHGAQPLSLGVLTDDEGRRLLDATLGPDRADDDEPALAELVALCGGFPLALGLIAARVRHHLSPAEAVAELRESGLDALDADDPTASLPAVLSWSLRRLTEPQRTAFALLGSAPGPDIGLPAATSLTGLPERETRAVLRTLVDASLLERTPGGRYAMHDLVRAYAATHAHVPEPVRHAALGRVVDFYLHTAHAADRVFDPHTPLIPPEPPAAGVHPHPLPDQRAALAWVDAEHPHLLTAQRTAADLGRHHTAWHFARALTGFHLRWRRFHDSLAVWQAALEAAEHLPDHGPHIQAHRNIGGACSSLGRHEEAIAHLHRALALSEQHHDTLHQAHNHHALAEAWAQRGDDHRALDHARRSLELNLAFGNPVWDARALNAVAWYATRTGDHDTAREHCLAALDRYRDHRDPLGEADTLDTLGLTEHRSGRHEEAVRQYRRAIDRYRALGHAFQVAETLDNSGHPHAALGRRDEARAVWREALALYRGQGREAEARRVQRQLDDLDAGGAADEGR
ncbi:AfsR/SARP family transcriptional regulator [Saccharothrix australiensis]|uniref:DNA-binding SARP family transcriptional activator n=1 Tax=Saccharothrix australiensis TaxID=2072 RepID=A0A495W4K7_9PSEU|nr:BTAD domain-containing putative transcriptional regulator [Saccharothrix australiensis]RKT54728.1 DNA-binding SARP family transcriptional activator [Saccharothrix australiensis]